MSTVFLGVLDADRAELQPLVDALAAAGVAVDVPEERDQTARRAALDAARVVLAVWTPASVASPQILAETQEARRQGKLLLLRARRVGFAEIPRAYATLHTEVLENRERIVELVKARIDPQAATAAAAERAAAAEALKPPAIRFRWRGVICAFLGFVLLLTFQRATYPGLMAYYAPLDLAQDRIEAALPWLARLGERDAWTIATLVVAFLALFAASRRDRTGAEVAVVNWRSVLIGTAIAGGIMAQFGQSHADASTQARMGRAPFKDVETRLGTDLSCRSMLRRETRYYQSTAASLLRFESLGGTLSARERALAECFKKHGVTPAMLEVVEQKLKATPSRNQRGGFKDPSTSHVTEGMEARIIRYASLLTWFIPRTYLSWAISSLPILFLVAGFALLRQWVPIHFSTGVFLAVLWIGVLASIGFLVFMTVGFVYFFFANIFGRVFGSGGA